LSELSQKEASPETPEMFGPPVQRIFFLNFGQHSTIAPL
jgi:hypothetical protein